MLIAAATMAPPEAGNEAPCLAGQDDQAFDSGDVHQTSNQLQSLPLHIQIQESKEFLPSAASASDFSEREGREDFGLLRNEPAYLYSSYSSSSCNAPVQTTCNIKRHESNSLNSPIQSRNRGQRHSISDDEVHCDADCEASLNGTHTHSASRKIHSISNSKTRRHRRRKLNSDMIPFALNESTPTHGHDDVLVRNGYVSVAAVSDATTGVQAHSTAPMEKDLNYNSSNSSNSLLLHTESPFTHAGQKGIIPCRYNYNAWDSSPSTVGDNDEQASNASLSMYFHPIQHEEVILEPGSNIQKSLFDTKDDDCTSFIPENNVETGLDITDESDLELTQRSRQIQIDLRVREMLELAQEAEKAAEEGREKFVGSATKFELGLGLDVGNRVVLDSFNCKMSPASGNACSMLDGLQCNRNVSEPITPPREKHMSRSRSQFYCFNTDLGRVRNSKRYVRQNSAPATVAAPTIRARSHSIPSLLTNGNIFSIAPTNQIKQQTISVLELRQIDEVIPIFKDMHSFMKMNFLRKGVKKEHLVGKIIRLKQHDDVNERIANEQKQDSRSMLRQHSIMSSGPMAFLPSVPSINMIMKTMSGLSNKEPDKADDLSKAKSLDKISKLDTETYDDGADTDLSLEPDDMALDCVSFVSCGDASVGVASSAENSVMEITCASSSTADENRVDEVSDKSETRCCILASELYDPNQKRRSVSPLPKAPYCLDDDHLELTPKRNCTKSKSRWADFWENISPVRKSISLPSPIRLQFPNSLEYKGGQWMQPNEILGTRKLSFKRLSASEQSLHFDAVENCENSDEPLEIEKDDLNNGVIISSQSYSQTIRRSTSPLNDRNNDGNDSPSANISISESVSWNGHSHNTAGLPIFENINLDKEGILLCKHNSSKRSFRTSTTQMSGEDSQSSSKSKLSCCSLQTGMNNVDNIQNDTLILTVRQINDNCSSSQIRQRSNLESCNKPLPTTDFDTLFAKPPLHPTDTQNIQICDESVFKNCSSYSKCADRKTDILPTIEASFSLRNFTETSSDLSINSQNEGSDIYREMSYRCNSRDQDLSEINCPKKSDPFELFLESDKNDHNFRKPANTETNARKTLFVGTEDDSSVNASPEELNKSMSFIDIMEKVPSVISRFRPFRKIKKDNTEFKNDVDFVRNYFFTNLEQKSSRVHVESNLTVQHDEQTKCGKHACIDLNCVSVIETAFRCLSTHNLTMDATDRNKSDLEYFQCKKYGNLNSSGMREKVRVGQVLYESPSLKVFKKVHKNTK